MVNGGPEWSYAVNFLELDPLSIWAKALWFILSLFFMIYIISDYLLPTLPCSFCDRLLDVEGTIIWLKLDELFWFWSPCIVGYCFEEMLFYCYWAIYDLRPTPAVLDPAGPSRSFSSIELLCLSGLSIEFIELSVFWICSYCFLLMLPEFNYCWVGAVCPGPNFRLKFTPELNWYTLIIDVFLFDWSMFAVLATKPLLLGPLPWAVPIAVPSWPS